MMVSSLEQKKHNPRLISHVIVLRDVGSVLEMAPPLSEQRNQSTVASEGEHADRGLRFTGVDGIR
jgi:hypothetical protein